VVGGQIVSRKSAWAWSVYDTETGCPQPAESDTIVIVPGLDQAQHIDRTLATNVEKVVELVGQRADVVDAELERLCRRRRQRRRQSP
jgi:hypothetical protein